ncbi:MAG: glycosyltransferase family 4 protein [Tissierellaceae bacterium]|nr:glycosyltransferase family 4 protein [Tissierellaceae bacterium]
MVKKVLFCASIQGHIRNFHTPYMKLFKENGYEVHVVGKDNLSVRSLKLDYVDKVYNINFERSPFKLRNLQIYRNLANIINDNKYDVIHCHTPLVGVLTRFAARNIRKNGSKVIYTAHGFHFCQGAPLKNWLLYYPIEKTMSYYTDCLITINKEDYERAIKGGFKAKKIVMVNGVGVNTDHFRPLEISDILKLREKFNYSKNQFLMFYAAEFNHNKNQQLLIKSIANLKKDIPNAKLVLAGTGPLLKKCQVLAEELGVSDMVDFLGFREDVNEILPMCDMVVASSLREGLPVNVMEAMATGRPLVVTDVRGHRDLVNTGVNGYVVKADDVKSFSYSIKKLYEDDKLRNEFGKRGIELVKKYSLENVLKRMEQIYLDFL